MDNEITRPSRRGFLGFLGATIASRSIPVQPERLLQFLRGTTESPSDGPCLLDGQGQVDEVFSSASNEYLVRTEIWSKTLKKILLEELSSFAQRPSKVAKTWDGERDS